VGKPVLVPPKNKVCGSVGVAFEAIEHGSSSSKEVHEGYEMADSRRCAHDLVPATRLRFSRWKSQPSVIVAGNKPLELGDMAFPDPISNAT
jgi:hypothetical protein